MGLGFARLSYILAGLASIFWANTEFWLLRLLCLKSRPLHLDTVSTTCDSGWVRSRAALCGLNAAHPPAIAGGTDRVQQKVLTFEARSLRQSGGTYA
jgi:hypothetical protein